MTQPSSEQQIQFLTDLQRLLNEGAFVATYKFALLSALADLCVERGQDTNAELRIPTREIAEKFVLYYWRQSRPFLPRGSKSAAFLLRQNTGREAAVISLLRQQFERGIDSVSDLRRDTQTWNRVVTKVNRTLCEMPLWKLQTVGASSMDFLYPNTMHGDSISLRPGVMFCCRKFHVFITDMVRGAWIRYVRRQNQDRLGDPTDLDEFLFGTERVTLSGFVSMLREIQSNRCFYCRKEVPRGDNHVDHFIPWAMYPVNLGHNFVLSDSRCNTAKSDHLAAFDHLAHWNSRNKEFASSLTDGFDRISAFHDIDASLTIAQWAYNRAFSTSAETFRSPGVFERLPLNFRERVQW